MTTISILTPAYNEEQFLPSMLESIQSQTCEDWELLLVDDGSTDKTARIIEEWAAKEPRIRVVSLRKKLGKVAAFNAAFAASSGDLVCHVGADDFLPKDSLSHRVRELDSQGGLGVHLGKLQMVDMTGSIIASAVPKGAKGSQSGPGATYTRRLASLLFPIPETLPSEDIWLGNGAVGCAETIVHSPEIVINYRVHVDNSNPRHKSFPEMTQSLHDRAAALSMLTSSSLPLRPEARADLEVRTIAETLRYTGDRYGLLRLKGLHPVDKLALMSMSHPVLWRLRQRAGVAATGWRGR